MGKSYLVEGARLKCICGSKCSSLKVTDHGYRADGKKKANCKDCLAEINITDFGTCKMNQQGKVCKGFMKLAEQWENTGGDSWKLEKLSGHTALTMDSVLLCKRGGIIVPETSGQGAVRKINWGAHLARYGMNRLASSLGKKDGCLYGRDPVNLNTGNFLYEKEDLVIGGVTKISFRMYYNSMDEYRGGSLGEGWHHNYEMYAEQKKEGTVHLHLGDGREILYRPKLGDLYTPVFGDAGLLKKETDGYRYVTGSTEYAFGSDGFIRTMTDRNGNTDMFLYNDKGQLAEVKGANGGVLHYEYNREGNLYRVYDHTGREVRLWYSYRVLQKFQNSMGYVYTYGYNENLRLESVTTPRGSWA
jgi:Rhs family protein